MNTVIIEIDGQDKVGKDVLHRYIEQLSNYKYIINSRGILTQLVYSDKFKRPYEYELTYKPFVVLLTADHRDLEIRCRINNEPKCNFEKDEYAFNYYADLLMNKGVAVVRYNTSKMTMLQIAEQVLRLYERYIENTSLLLEPLKLSTADIYDADDLKDEDVFYGGLTCDA